MGPQTVKKEKNRLRPRSSVCRSARSRSARSTRWNARSARVFGVSKFVPLFQGGRRAFCGRGSSLVQSQPAVGPLAREDKPPVFGQSGVSLKTLTSSDSQNNPQDIPQKRI